MPGVISYPVPTGTPQAPVISFNIGGYDPAEVGMILDKAFDIKVRASVQCANEAHRSLGTLPYGTVRVSPGYFNTEAEIEKTLQAIKMIVEVKLK